MTENSTPKSLSHDEKKAAEAAFAGRPFNPTWSAGARLVYDGIVKALPAPPDNPAALETTASTLLEQASTAQPPADNTAVEDETVSNTTPNPPATITDIKQAIESGVLIDVTSTAQLLGISFPMTITKPLWEMGIAAGATLTEEEQAGRLRDVLMAFRLRLASLTTVSPLLDFPALLALPPSTVPQLVPLFALIQPDHTHQASVTLLLPNEVSLSTIPMN